MKKILIAILIATLPNILSAQQITSAEYFFDSPDPGLGNAATISIGAPADSVNFSPSVSISGLSGGLHVLHLRTMNSDGVWSLYEPRTFYVAGDTAKLTAAECFYDTDPGFGNGNPINILLPGDSVTINNATSIVPPLSLGAHTFYFRVRSGLGLWSMYEPRDITICSTYGALSNFDFHVNGNLVYFNNKSEYDSTHFWMFGDGNTSSEVFTSHTYSSGAVYNACLVTSNSCHTDTICKEIGIRGIQKVSPNITADTNYLVMRVWGFGFDTTSTVRFIKQGQSDVICKATYFVSAKELNTVFILNGAPNGWWDVVVSTPGFPEDTLAHAILIEPSLPGELSLQLISPGFVITGSTVKMQIVCTNNGNTTKIGVPLIIQLPGIATATLRTPVNTYGYDPVVIDSLEHFWIARDSVHNDSVLMCILMVPFISPHSSQIVEFYNSYPNHGIEQIHAQLGQPWYSFKEIDSLGLRSCDFLNPCQQCVLDLSGLVPFVSCFSGGFGVGCSFSNLLSQGAHEFQVLDLVGNISSTIINCAGVHDFKYVVNYGKIWSLFAGNASNAGSLAAGWGDELFGGLPPGSCSNCLHPPDVTDPNIHWDVSVDPNCKTGPIGGSSQNYISGRDPMNFRVYFSNLDSATAAASRAMITDTLDQNVFDLSSFKFTSFGLGDSIFQLDYPMQSFTYDLDLRPIRNCILRVIGSFDSLTGLASCTFLSLDTINHDIVVNTFDGFLPPDSIIPNGEANFSYVINARPGLPQLQTLTNDADIIFDANLPIRTNNFINTIDTVPPASSMDALIPIQSDSVFIISWNGTDNDAGIGIYDIYVSANGGTFGLWASPITYTSATFYGKPNTVYSFYSIAIDKCNNIEEKAPIAEATTTTIGIRELSNTNILIIQNKPNPFTGNTIVDFKLANAQRARLEITDLFGRVVYLSAEMKYNAGKNSIEVGSTMFSQGLYNYRIIAEQGNSQTKKMMKY